MVKIVTSSEVLISGLFLFLQGFNISKDGDLKLV